MALSSKYMKIIQIKTFKILKTLFNWVHYVTFHLCARVTKRQTDSYRAQRVYFGLWHSRSMLCLCLGKTFFIHLLSTGSPRHSADTVHFPDEAGGWTLCLSSDMFSTCYAGSNRQNISMIMIKQRLVLQERVKLSQALAIVHALSSLLSQRCSSWKVRYFIVLQS